MITYVDPTFNFKTITMLRTICGMDGHEFLNKRKNFFRERGCGVGRRSRQVNVKGDKWGDQIASDRVSDTGCK
jgi:hypothetical protein